MALQRALENESILNQAQGLWIGMPSLRDAADKLIERVTVAWPGLDGGGSAAVKAIVNAIKLVAHGLENGETTRELVVANFMRGMSTVANDLASIEAWGLQESRTVEQWDARDFNFQAWASSGRFDEVRFYKKASIPVAMLDGMKWKIMCEVASLRDVGIMSRFSGRELR